VPGAKPYGQLQYKQINGKRMAYIDEGQGSEDWTIVLQHGNPTSSYLWRNVMPHLEGLGRLVACDLIGMGGSDKLDDSGPDRYHYAEQREYLFALWDELDLGDRVILVLHDWGSALGFDWANQHRDRVAGIAYMEAVTMPIDWSDFPGPMRNIFQGFRSPEGESMALDQNVFVERVLPASVRRALTDEEMDHYRKPFRNPGEDRRPTLSWPRNIPIEGEPADVVATVEEYGAWLAQSDVPKLFIKGEPGALIRGRALDFVRTWPTQTEVSVPGVHFIQEDSADEIGAAVAAFVRAARASGCARIGRGIQFPPVTELLFSYGTLRQPDVQRATFRREIDGRPDAIVGYHLDYVTITDPHVIATSGSDRHPILKPTDRADAAVEGMVFAISEADLAAADEYEVDDYRRITVPLRSGGEAWVYVFAG